MSSSLYIIIKWIGACCRWLFFPSIFILTVVELTIMLHKKIHMYCDHNRVNAQEMQVGRYLAKSSARANLTTFNRCNAMQQLRRLYFDGLRLLTFFPTKWSHIYTWQYSNYSMFVFMRFVKWMGIIPACIAQPTQQTLIAAFENFFFSFESTLQFQLKQKKMKQRNHFFQSIQTISVRAFNCHCFFFF